MNDGIGARPRLNWNSVTDSGGDAPPRGPDDQGGFAFNLGNALAKLGLDPDVPVADRAAASSALDAFPPVQRREPAAGGPPPGAPVAAAGLPSRQRTTDEPPAMSLPAQLEPDLAPLQRRERADGVASGAPPLIVDEPLPRRANSAPVEPRAAERPAASYPTAEQELAPLPARAPAQPIVEPAPADIEPIADPVSRSYVAPRRSVFDDVVSPSPQLPPTVVSSPAGRRRARRPPRSSRPAAR